MSGSRAGDDDARPRHEIKNPLSTIGLNVQLLQEDAADIERAAEDQPAIAEQAGKVRRRLGTLGREAVRLREILEDFLRVAGRMDWTSNR